MFGSCVFLLAFVLAKMDLNGDGKIGTEEFYAMMTSKHLAEAPPAVDVKEREFKNF